MASSDQARFVHTQEVETGASGKAERSRFQRVHVRWKETLAFVSQSNELSDEFDRAISKLSLLPSPPSFE